MVNMSCVGGEGVCVCTCMHVCMRTCVFVCIRSCVRVCMCVPCIIPIPEVIILQLHEMLL